MSFVFGRISWLIQDCVNLGLGQYIRQRAGQLGPIDVLRGVDAHNPIVNEKPVKSLDCREGSGHRPRGKSITVQLGNVPRHKSPGYPSRIFHSMMMKKLEVPFDVMSIGCNGVLGGILLQLEIVQIISDEVVHCDEDVRLPGSVPGM